MKKTLLTIACSLLASASLYAADKPEFPGGQSALDKYLADNVKYPQMAKDNGVEGIVGVQFIVHTDGTLGTIKIIRMVDPDLEQEALRVVKNMPAWIPADKNGEPIEAPAQVNVPFVLE